MATVTFCTIALLFLIKPHGATDTVPHGKGRDQTITKLWSGLGSNGEGDYNRAEAAQGGRHLLNRKDDIHENRRRL
jgi:hypothetical protein